jgi:predicted membrane protein
LCYFFSFLYSVGRAMSLFRLLDLCLKHFFFKYYSLFWIFIVLVLLCWGCVFIYFIWSSYFFFLISVFFFTELYFYIRKSQYLVRDCAKQSGWCEHDINIYAIVIFDFQILTGYLYLTFQIVQIERRKKNWARVKRDEKRLEKRKTKQIRNLHTATLCYQCRSCRVTRSRWA